MARSTHVAVAITATLALWLNGCQMALAQLPDAEPIKMPGKCKTRSLRTTADCACYLLVTGQIVSQESGQGGESALMRCAGMYGSEAEVLALGNSCRRFVNAKMEIMTDILSEASTEQTRTCIDAEAAPVQFALAGGGSGPVAGPVTIELQSRMCLTRRFRNIVGCACYLLATGQVVGATDGDMMRWEDVCAGVVGGVEERQKGGTKCRKFVGGRSGRIMIRRLAFQANLYEKRCIAGAEEFADVVFEITEDGQG